MKNRDNVPAAGGFFLKIRLKLAYFSYILTLFLSKSEGAKTYFGPLTLKSEGAMAPWPPLPTPLEFWPRLKRAYSLNYQKL